MSSEEMQDDCFWYGQVLFESGEAEGLEALKQDAVYKGADASVRMAILTGYHEQLDNRMKSIHEGEGLDEGI